MYFSKAGVPLTALQPATDVLTQRPDWGADQEINLVATPALQNLTAGQTVIFRIPVYSPATSQSLEFDDLTVRGNLSPTVAPPYAGSDRLFFRVRQE